MILAQLCSDDSLQILLNLTQVIILGTKSNLEGFVWSHQIKTGLVCARQFTLLVFGKWAFQNLFFQNIPTNPLISKIFLALTTKRRVTFLSVIFLLKWKRDPHIKFGHSLFLSL